MTTETTTPEQTKEEIQTKLRAFEHAIGARPKHDLQPLKEFLGCTSPAEIAALLDKVMYLQVQQQTEALNGDSPPTTETIIQTLQDYHTLRTLRNAFWEVGNIVRIED